MDVRQVIGGRYKLLNELGSGGMAVVWRARDEVLGRPVAVKVLAAQFAGDPQSRARIRDEARAAANLSHPNIAQVYDYGEADDGGTPLPYVVMELVNGPTLQQRMASSPLPPRKIFRICGEVAAALAVAHAEDLVHRDIKMANIMVTPAGAKVVDFGIAAAVGPAPEDMLVGTPAYLAPERLTGGDVVPASDVYALGVLLFRLLAGESPWSVESTTQMLKAHVYVDPAPLPRMAGVPSSVADLISRCLHKDPADRPTAAEVSSTLADAAEASLAPGVRRGEDAEPGAFGAAKSRTPAAPDGHPIGGFTDPISTDHQAGRSETVSLSDRQPPSATDRVREATGAGASAAASEQAAARSRAASVNRARAASPAWGGSAAVADRTLVTESPQAGPSYQRGVAATTAVIPARPTRSRRAGSPHPSRKTVLAAGGIAAAVIAALAIWLLTGNSTADPQRPSANQTATLPSAAGALAGAPSASSGFGAPIPAATAARSHPAANGSLVAPSAVPPGSPGASANAPAGGPSAPVNSASASPSASAAPAGKRLASKGGAVYATCADGKATLTGWEPADGYTVEYVDAGPALGARIIFKSEKDRNRINVTCVAGNPTPVLLPL